MLGQLLATLLPFVLLGAALWMILRVIPRQRRRYAEHPELRPYGRQLLARASPFIALAVVVCIWGLTQEDPAPVVLGAAGALGLAWAVWRRWERPTA